MEKEQLVIELKNITKTFGSVVANDNVNLSVKKGEILALLGENGSGKTTLMNMLSGIYKPDSGEILVNGVLAKINSPEDSKKYGIGMVHQHFKLVDNFSATDNIWIGEEGSKEIFLNSKRFEEIEKISEKFGFEIDTKKSVHDMSVSEKQTVEILKVLFYGADLLILDEPTAVLTLQETRKLFSILRKMSAAGCSIIIITHKLNEVLEISDRVTILRKGQSIGTVNTSETNASKLTNMMVGRQVDLHIDRPEPKEGEEVLEINNLTIIDEEGIKAIDDISFKLSSGEILGVAGVSGCGQKELCEAIAGLQKIENGTILYKGEHIEDMSPREIIKRGITMSFIPEDRLGMGLAASLSITDNMMLKKYNEGNTPFVDRKNARVVANKVIDDLEIATPSSETPVRRLSGGNIQKVLVGREIDADPHVIVTAYPVRGLDINSSYAIYNILNKQKELGVGVLFVGEDLDVMLELCDRIVVLCHGKITGIVDAKQTNKEELGLLMTDALSEESKEEVEEIIQKAEIDIDSEIKFSDKEYKQKENVKIRQPLFRIVKRDNLSNVKIFSYYLLAIIAAMVAGGLLVASMGVNPILYYKSVITGCFENAIYFKGFIRIVIPLTITSLGIAFAFKMKFWNIGANGQFVMGAIAANTVGLLVGNSFPQWLTLLLMLIGGAIGGAIWGAIPAFLKIKWNTNETLLTLMLNYIAYYLLTYLKNTMFYRKLTETGEVLRPDFRKLPENAWLYEINLFGVNVDISLIIAIILVVLTFVYFKYTKQGYEISVVGESKNTARYAGMNVKKVIVRTMIISSAIVGIAGMFQVSGTATSHTLSDGISSDVGWTGIIVAWLAKLNAIGILLGSVLMAILEKGAAIAETTFDVSSATSAILEGVILFTILAADFFIRYSVVRKRGSE